MIVIPMAGLSSRFFKAGYKVPKYMLPVGAESVFSQSVKSFEKYFKTDEFVFICRDIYDTPSFVKSELIRIGVKNFKIKILDRETSGQAETVILGLAEYDDVDNIIIFNIDTFRPGFVKPNFNGGSAGYVETFIGSGKNWSNVLPGSNFEVIKTAEKQEISEYCCSGLYGFSKLSYLRESFIAAINTPELTYGGEYYIAPLYNHLIANGLIIHYSVIASEDIIFCGTPDEYLTVISSQ